MKNNFSHIVILIPGFAADDNDENCLPYVQSYVLSLKKIAPQKRITVIAFHYPFVSKMYLWNGIEVHAIGGGNKKYFFKVITWIKAIVCFLKINRANKVSSIQSFWLRECSMIGLFLSKFYSINFIPTLIGQDSKKENIYLKLFQFFEIKTASCSTFNAQVYNQSTGKNCFKIIPLGISEKQKSEGLVISKSFRTIDIIGVGSLIPVKNYSLFLEIIQELTFDFPKLRVVLMGGGYEEKILKQKAIELGLSNNLDIKGYIDSRSEVQNLIASSKILLHTSNHEGQCYAFLEALSLGLHVVSFKVGHLPETKKSHPCDSKAEMIIELKKLLSSNIENTPEKIISMDETATEFSKILN